MTCGSSLSEPPPGTFSSMRTKKISIEPVKECIHKPMADTYVELNDNMTNPPDASGECFPLVFSSLLSQSHDQSLCAFALHYTDDVRFC
jgi:hypothetical protein